MERRSIFLAAALALPIVGLISAWGITHRKAQMGTDWEVPISGYDPRDLLRGHYITFQYDWPRLTRDEFGLSEICIEGTAPTIVRVTIPNRPVVEEGGQSQPPAKCAVTARAPIGANDQGNDLRGGIFYLPQEKAADYEKKLRDPKLQGVITLRIREDGITRPTALTFRERSVPAVGQDGSIRP
jgi:hypothetical protein